MKLTDEQIKDFMALHPRLLRGSKDGSLLHKVWISPDGQFFNETTGHLLTIFDKGECYQYVELTRSNGMQYHYRIHRLIAEVYCTIPVRYLLMGLTTDDLEVHHLDYNRQNNHYLNLKWVSPGYHDAIEAHQKKYGILPFIKENGRAYRNMVDTVDSQYLEGGDN